MKILGKKLETSINDVKNRDYYAAIHLAAQNNHKECVEYLINNMNSEPNLTGKYKATPLMLAC